MSEVDTIVNRMKPAYRLDYLAAWVEKHGFDAVHAASGYTNRRTVQQYISQQRPPSWVVFHRIRRELGEECA